MLLTKISMSSLFQVDVHQQARLYVLVIQFLRICITKGNIVEKIQILKEGYQLPIHIILFLIQIIHLINISPEARQEMVLMPALEESIQTLIRCPIF